MVIYFAGVHAKDTEFFFIKKKCSRLYSYVDLTDMTRAFGAIQRFEEFVKGKRKRRIK